jgi:SAM-dependent methyltransferase
MLLARSPKTCASRASIEPLGQGGERSRAARGLDGRFEYRQGEAERLPFPDDSFDLTTCQTVLIHLRDPAAAIAEMRRVTRPGGLVAVAEPNNLTETLFLDSISNQAGVDEIVERVRFQLTCERGKVALGEGDNSLGDLCLGCLWRRTRRGRGTCQRQCHPISCRMPRATSCLRRGRDRLNRRLLS